MPLTKIPFPLELQIISALYLSVVGKETRTYQKKKLTEE